MGCFAPLVLFYDGPIKFRIDVKQEIFTDQNGEAQFPVKTLSMGCYQVIYEARIAINLDFGLLDRGLYEDEFEFLRIGIDTLEY